MNPKNFGMAGGVVWGLLTLIVTMISINTGYASSFITMMQSWYPGYTVTYVGAVVGLVCGFVHAFIVLYALATVYNKLEES